MKTTLKIYPHVNTERFQIAALRLIIHVPFLHAQNLFLPKITYFPSMQPHPEFSIEFISRATSVFDGTVLSTFPETFDALRTLCREP